MLVLGATSLFVILYPNSNQKNKTEGTESSVLALSSYHDDNGISISYPSTAQVSAINEEEKKQGFMLRLRSNTSPEYLANIRIEKGLRLPSQLSKLSVLDLVVDGATRSLPSRYPNYRVIDENESTVDGKNAYKIQFIYDGPAGEQITQKITLIEKDTDSAVYVSQQSRTIDFPTLDDAIFQPMLNSVKFD